MKMIDEEDIRKEAEEISKEDIKDKGKSPIWIILGFVLVLLIIMMVVPFYSVKLDPEPRNIPAIDDVISSEIELSNKSYELNSSFSYGDLVNPLDPVIKQTADKVASLSCKSNKICYAKAIYYFVRDNINYVSDPIGKEYVEEPREVLVLKAGDCESGSILLSSLIEAIGIDAQMVFISGHAFVRIKLANARNKYKQPDGWIYLDWTCKRCEFGEIPYQNVDKYKSFVDV